MKFFNVILLTCMTCASSVFAHLNKLNDAEERRTVVSQLDPSNDSRTYNENVISNERAQATKREISPEDISLEDVLLNKKVSSSEFLERESMRTLQHNNEILRLEKRANEQSETNTKNSQPAPAAITERRFADLGHKVGEIIDQMLANIKKRIKMRY